VLGRLLAEAPWRAAVDWPAGFEGGIAHRLDNATSGAVLVADGLAELADVRAAFASGALTKTYLARVARQPSWSQNACDRQIAHDARHKRRMVVQRGPSTPHRGRWLPAHTSVRVLAGDLVEVTITTGVMHQIRVHLAFLGTPLLGDALYGGGQPPAGASSFYLHHVGLRGAGVATSAVPGPGWAER
jgi:23S rRNA pseudouridine1911/1915/1917 synthase